MATGTSYNMTGVPSAVNDLGFGGSMSPEEIAQRKKKLMSAASADPMARFGNAAFALFGNRGASAASGASL